MHQQSIEPSSTDRRMDGTWRPDGAAPPALTNLPVGQIADVLASVSDGFVVLDADWRLTYINAAAERLTGSKAAELIGHSIFEILDIRPDSPLHAAYLASKQSGQPIALTAYAEIFSCWLEVRGYPHAQGYSMFFRDVTDERAAWYADQEGTGGSRTSSSINQRLFETSLDLIYVVDSQGNFFRVSPSALDILGYRPEEMVGRNAIEFIHQDDLEKTREQMRQARKGRLTTHFDCRYVHKDGHVVPLSWTGVWSAPDGQHIFIGRDMTDRLAAEERARHSQRLEAIGQLTGGIAHDFNNLLAIVIGSLELLFDQPNLGPQATLHGRSALHAAQRGAELTRRLLAFARQQSLDPRVVDTNALIGNLATLLSRTLGQHIEVTFLPAADAWPTYIDPANLEAALANLAVNARDAMPAGGRLMIETRNAHFDPEYVAANPGAAAGDYVEISVTDTGAGMPPDVLSRIFEPFFTTKESGKGTGLGLSMVFGFVKQSGGHIKAYSEVGVGTCMRVYLPRAHGAQIPTPAPAVAPPAASPRQELILVVEDNDAIRQVVLLQLAKLGYRTLEAESAAAALQLIDSGAAIDLLFTDIVMPGGVSGHVLAREARAKRPGLKVLFTSGFPGALLAEADGLVTSESVLGKPYRSLELAQKIRAVLDR